MSQKITITIDVGNAAFEDYNGGNEVARILRKLADQYEETGLYTFARLADVNGNQVGEAAIYDE